MDREKWLVLKYQGYEYAVPVSIIAANYAIEYEGHEDGDTYEDLFSFIIGRDFELTDWAFNNMNPDDFGDHWVLVSNLPPTFADAFMHCDQDYAVVIGDPRCATK